MMDHLPTFTGAHTGRSAHS